MHNRLVCVLGAVLGLVSGTGLASEPDPRLPEPSALEGQIEFWKRIYVEIGTDAGFVHDNRYLGVVYETVHRIPESGHARRKTPSRERQAHWRRTLLALGRGAAPRPGSETDARTAARLWEAALGRIPTREEYRSAAERLRFQRGQRNRFDQGLARSTVHDAWIRGILVEHGVPPDLAYLPHVESSFNPHAYSKHGAAGIWQFMPTTARRYLKVDRVVDERLDLEKATRAAARLLRHNYKRLGAWPLAITAYNHGAGGMLRARVQLGTTDIAEIIAEYDGPRFGFASRNFYVQLLAARRAARLERRLGESTRTPVYPAHKVQLPFYLDFASAARAFGVPRAQLQALNPSLRPQVLRSEKYIPKGFTLKLPNASPPSDTWLTRITSDERHLAQRPSRTHTVRRGETLGHIAVSYGTTVSSLMAANGLGNRHRIFPGQLIELKPGASRHKRPTPGAPASKSSGAPRQALASSADAVVPPPPGTAPAPESAVPALALAAPVPVPVPVPVAESAAPAVALAAPAPVLVPAAAPAAAPAAVAAQAPPAAAVAVVPPARRLLDGDWATVAHDETLGHYADWLELPTSGLRRMNRLARRDQLRVGQRLRLDFSGVAHDLFNQRRAAHHRAVEQRYLARYRVTGAVNHTLRDGENLWVLSNKVYGLPGWLLQRYNPGAEKIQLLPGTRIRVPTVQPVQSG